MSANYFFSETPYAVALGSNWLSSRCSNCFGRAKPAKPCSQGCKQIVYCSDECMRIDAPWHENECAAFRNGQTRLQDEFNDVQIRLTGRILTRLAKDRGRAILSSDFPRHVVKDRRFADLISHDREQKSSRRSPAIESVINDFASFFATTPLVNTKPAQIVHLMNVTKINGFSITCLSSSGDPRILFDMGEGVYLNASRFNHSCAPNLIFSFDGSRLVVKRIGGGNSNSNGNGNGSTEANTAVSKSPSNGHPTSISKKEMKNLTFNYGFGSNWNHFSALSLTSQRLRSLKDRYFFRCRCKLCVDEKASKLQSDASILECTTCGRATVWRIKDEKVSLKPTCKCPDKSKPFKRWCRDPDIQAEMVYLNDMWDSTMTKACSDSNPPDWILANLDTVFQLARKYWHPTFNLRLGQLFEKVSWAHGQRVIELKADGRPYDEQLRRMLEAGESMLKIYLHHALPTDLTMAILLVRLAIRYPLKKDDGDDEKTKWERASELCKMAAEIWKRNGEFGGEKFLLNLARSMETRDKDLVNAMVEAEERE